MCTFSDSASDSVPNVFRLMGTGPGGGLGRGGSLYNVLHWQATGVLLAKAYESVGNLSFRSVMANALLL